MIMVTHYMLLVLVILATFTCCSYIQGMLGTGGGTVETGDSGSYMYSLYTGKQLQVANVQ